MENHVATGIPLTGPAYWPATEGESIGASTIGDALRRAATRWPDDIALIDGAQEKAERRRWSFRELLESAEQVAYALLTRFRPGEHVAVWAPNCHEWVLIEFGAALAGVVLVAVNPAYLASELAFVLSQSQSVGILFCPEYRGRNMEEVLAEVLDDLPLMRECISLFSWEQFLESATAGEPLPQVKPDDVAQIQYTSGTTGSPKGAQLTQCGLAVNGRLYAEAIGAYRGDVWINPMPMFHTAGCGLVTLGALQTGGAHVLPSTFSPALMLDLFESERGTIMLSVPTMLIRILEHPGIADRDLRSWRLTTLGGAPVSPELVRRAKAALDVEVAIGFGQTEASPYITHTVPGETRADWSTTVGRPLPEIEVRIADPESGSTLRIGEVGELCTRSRCVMRGYFNKPEETSNVLDVDGWLHTGDLASMDADGYLSIRGRLRDMIIRGGENIFPREVEDTLLTHPQVTAAAVVGIPDAEWGEVVAAFVQLRAGATLSDTDLSDFCRQSLASYKTPRIWRFVSDFPQTASGKVQKFELRKMLAAAARS